MSGGRQPHSFFGSRPTEPVKQGDTQDITGDLKKAKSQDDILKSIENYAAETISFDELKAQVGYETVFEVDPLDAVLLLLEAKHLQTLKESLTLRVGLPAYQFSSEVAKRTYWESAKASALPSLAALVLGGPFVAAGVGAAVFSTDQGIKQAGHRGESRKRAEELLQSIARLEGVRSSPSPATPGGLSK